MVARKPLLIAHRGASGYLPEHTLAAYSLAIVQGADYIEPDLVATRDGVLVARHENEIGGTTDVSAHPEFAARRRTQRIDGSEVTGWFTEDFTLAELKTLRAQERIPQLRPDNSRHDGRLEVPTFEEILALLAQVNATRALAGQASIGVYPETKHPSHFAAHGLALEPLLLKALKIGLGRAPVFIQCFEVGNLRALRRQCEYPLVQLMAGTGGPWDMVAENAHYATMATRAGLHRVADYATAIGVEKTMVMKDSSDGLVPTALVVDAHAERLAVHVWTFRAENQFLPQALRRVDGLFCDFPDLARTTLDAVTAGAAKGHTIGMKNA